MKIQKYTLIIILSLLLSFGINCKEKKDASFKDVKPEIDIIISALDKIETRYFNFEEIDYGNFIMKALSKLERVYNDILVLEPSEEEVEIIINEESLELDIDSIEDREEFLSLIKKIVLFINENHNPVFKGNVSYGKGVALLSGTTDALDKHTKIMTGMRKENYDIRIKGTLGGVGMRVGKRDDWITAVSIMPDTPAMRAGLKDGDIIAAIDHESTMNISVRDAVARMRGDPGTKVVLTINREQEFEKKDIKITREIINLDNVKSAVLKKNLGFIQISNFSSKTLENFEKHLLKIRSSVKRLKGLIIDLRNNRGGNLNQAIELADLFVDSGVLLKNEGINKSLTKSVLKVYKASKEGTNLKLPLVILVNSSSASASEIVTGILKIKDRALIIGGKTFGKGNIQRLYTLNENTKLKMTIGRYLLPDGSWIHDKGIMPHIETLAFLFKDGQIRFKNLFNDTALTKKSGNESSSELDVVTRDNVLSLYYFKEKFKKKSGHKFKRKATWQKNIKKDFEVELASQILTSHGSNKAGTMLDNSRALVGKLSAGEETKIIKRFKKETISWQADNLKKEDAFISADLMTIRLSNLDVLSQKENGELNFEISNKSDMTLFRVFGEISSSHSYFNGQKIVFGNIPPKSVKKIALLYSISLVSFSKMDKLEIDFYDQIGQLPLHYENFFKLKERVSPEFTTTTILFDDRGKGNGNKRIDIDETITMQVKLKNRSKVSSGKLKVYLENPLDKDIKLIKGMKYIDELGPDREAAIEFGFKFLREVITGDTLKLKIFDLDYKTAITYKFKIYNNRELFTGLKLVPPVIKENRDKIELLTKKNEIDISGTVEDDKGLKLIQIFNNNNKIFLDLPDTTSKSDAKSFKAKVKLEDGVNRIIIKAIDNDELTASEKFYLYKAN